MTHPPSRRITARAATAIAVLGVLGFVPGVTTDYGQLAFAGHRSTAMLFGLFRVSVLGNLLLLAAGLAGLALTRRAGDAPRIVSTGGIVFLGLWLLGVVKAGGWIPLNVGDDWLDLGVGVCLLRLGQGASQRSEPARR